MANVKNNLLTAAKIKSLTAPGTHTDGNGLVLRVADTGAKSWILRYTLDGKRGNTGLGAYPAVGLKEGAGTGRIEAPGHPRGAQPGRG